MKGVRTRDALNACVNVLRRITSAASSALHGEGKDGCLRQGPATVSTWGRGGAQCADRKLHARSAAGGMQMRSLMVLVARPAGGRCGAWDRSEVGSMAAAVAARGLDGSGIFIKNNHGTLFESPFAFDECEGAGSRLTSVAGCGSAARPAHPPPPQQKAPTWQPRLPRQLPSPVLSLFLFFLFLFFFYVFLSKAPWISHRRRQRGRRPPSRRRPW